MPTIELDKKDFETLLGIKLPEDQEKLDDLLSYVKGQVKQQTEQELSVEIKDSNRPDMWGVEGLTRTLRGFLGLEGGLKIYSLAGSSGIKVKVSSKLRDIRPYIGCAIIKQVHLTDIIIKQAMRLQDKLDQTYGRNRRRTSIGLYNLDLISPPLSYSVAKPDDISFVPLGFTEKMTLRQILEKHPKGLEYGHIVKMHKVWPLLSDSRENVLSFPPVINSDDLGKITEKTRNVLIEVTGTSHETVLNTLNLVAVSLADRGGKIYSTEINYPYGQKRKTTTPQLKTKTMRLDSESILKVLGFNLSDDQLCNLLSKARYGMEQTQKQRLRVVVPCYRVDIMHQVDIIEDLAIAYGYDKIKPRWQRLPVTGNITQKAEFSDLVREIMIGLGYQEVLNFVMSNPGNLQVKMRIKPEKTIDVANPRMTTLTCLRDWLLPSLLEFLSHNTHVEYPQRIFEVGYAVASDDGAETRTKDTLKLACVSIHSDANFSEIKSSIEALLTNLALKRRRLNERDHPSFLEGRAAAIYVQDEEIGMLGEIHPEVLNNWQLKNPASAFEINLEEIL